MILREIPKHLTTIACISSPFWGKQICAIANRTGGSPREFHFGTKIYRMRHHI